MRYDADKFEEWLEFDDPRTLGEYLETLRADTHRLVRAIDGSRLGDDAWKRRTKLDIERFAMHVVAASEMSSLEAEYPDRAGHRFAADSLMKCARTRRAEGAHVNMRGMAARARARRKKAKS